MTRKTPDGLTDQQWNVYRFICREVADKQRVPTYREIAEYIDSDNPSAARGHVEALIRKGWIRKAGGFGEARQLYVPAAMVQIDWEWRPKCQ